MPIRTFIAVELAQSVRGRAQDLIKKLRTADVKATWVRPEQMHLTLKFLGDVPDQEIPEVCQLVQEAVRDLPAFEMSFRGCGAFPSLENPRTVWIGVEEGGEELTMVHEAVDQAMKRLRFPRETRRYRPHLTLGRIRESGPGVAELARQIEEFADYDADLSVVDEVVTFASFLDKNGPSHDVMGRAELQG